MVKQIHELPAGSAMATTDQFAVDIASNLSRKLTGQQMLAFMQSSIAELAALNKAQLNTSYSTPSHSEGLLYWDSSAKSLAVMTDISDVVLQVGQEFYIRCTNSTGDTIANGTPVYISGINGGGLPTIEKAQANEVSTSLVAGLTTSSIANGAQGFITKIGLVRGINTDALSTGSVYLSEDVAGGLTSTRPNPPASGVRIGQVLVSDASDGVILVDVDQDESEPQTMTLTSPLRSVVDDVINMTGELRTVASAQTANYTTTFAVSNNHAFVLVNSITGTGTVTFTGTSLSESSAVPVVSDTEVVNIDGTADQYYQSAKKWWEITDITFSAGITAINYDVGVVGYTDLNNQNFTLLSYRLDMVAQGTGADIRFRVIKIQDDGSGKMSVIDVENIGVDSGSTGDQIIDGIRTGDDDRSYNPAIAQLWPDNSTLVLKQGDFASYYAGGENDFYSGDKNEGMIIRFEGAPSGGISNVDFAALQLRYRAL